jgi:hypothetical protein
VVGVSGTDVSNGIAQSRIDLSYVYFRNVPPSSVYPYEGSEMSKFTATTPLIIKKKNDRHFKPVPCGYKVYNINTAMLKK